MPLRLSFDPPQHQGANQSVAQQPPKYLYNSSCPHLLPRVTLTRILARAPSAGARPRVEPTAMSSSQADLSSEGNDEKGRPLAGRKPRRWGPEYNVDNSRIVAGSTASNRFYPDEMLDFLVGEKSGAPIYPYRLKTRGSSALKDLAKNLRKSWTLELGEENGEDVLLYQVKPGKRADRLGGQNRTFGWKIVPRKTSVFQIIDQVPFSALRSTAALGCMPILRSNLFCFFHAHVRGSPYTVEHARSASTFVWGNSCTPSNTRETKRRQCFRPYFPVGFALHPCRCISDFTSGATRLWQS